VITNDEHWRNAASQLVWNKPFRTISAPKGDGTCSWFPDGEINTCYNAVDRHVDAGNGDRLALIYESAMTGDCRKLTYSELRAAVARTAGMLASQGVKKGDRVIIFMPMIPEAVFAMLACARIGAIHSVVFGGFASAELAKRIDDAEPSLILWASCGLEPARLVPYQPLVDGALALAQHKVERTIVFQRPQCEAPRDLERDVDWQTALADATEVDCVTLKATDPLYILYTSGTTGVPKGVVRDNGGHAVALRWSMENVYGAKPDDVFWAASDLGWVVGHSYIVYGPLLAGCTTVMFEGKPVGSPDAAAFWRVIEKHRVNILFTAPTAIRAIRGEDAGGEHIQKHALQSLRTLFLAGERADPETLSWASAQLGIPVIDNWWQTELGWPAIATCVGGDHHPPRHGSAGHPVPGYDIAILDGQDQLLKPGKIGDIVIKLPLPPGCLPTLWRNDDGFKVSYLSQHPGYYHTGDAGMIDKDGYVHVMSRTDDIINVAGHRLSTGGIEQVVLRHPSVAECAVVGIGDRIKGEVPVGFVVLNAQAGTAFDTLEGEIVRLVRDDLGPVAVFKTVYFVEALPKTRSGKILRGVIRQVCAGQVPTVPATIENAHALDFIGSALERSGRSQKSAAK
jgi:propionyl-CoA synthetase